MPMIMIRVKRLDGITDSTTSAKIRVGIDISRSTNRDNNWSNQPPMTAAVNPRIEPRENDSKVAMEAMKMVVRAP